MEPEDEQLNPIDALRKCIKDSPAAIEKELARSENDWLSCFGTRVFLLETYLYSAKSEGFLNLKDYSAYQERLEQIKQKLQELKKEGHQQNQALKTELMGMLDIFSD